MLTFDFTATNRGSKANGEDLVLEKLTNVTGTGVPLCVNAGGTGINPDGSRCEPGTIGRIDHARAEHLWAQVAADLRSEIDAGRLASGAKLPNELELASQYGVARLTVRRAIADLVDGGYLLVLRGRGTYVREKGRG